MLVFATSAFVMARLKFIFAELVSCPLMGTWVGEASRAAPFRMSAETLFIDATMPPRPSLKPGTKLMADRMRARLMMPMNSRAV